MAQHEAGTAAHDHRRAELAMYASLWDAGITADEATVNHVRSRLPNPEASDHEIRRAVEAMQVGWDIQRAYS